MQARIAILDAQPCVCEGLKAVISGQEGMSCIGTCITSGNTDPLTYLPDLKPNVIILDSQMDDMDGITLVGDLKNILPRMAILVFTSQNDRQFVRSCLSSGASGYVLKSSSPAMIIQAIRTVVAGGIFLDHKVAGHITHPPFSVQEISDVAHKSVFEEEGIMSRRERDVLKYTAMGLTGKEIAFHLGISTKTVETYRSRAKVKLDLHNRADIVRFATQKGWLEV
jgi:DNA-binding NarL/FixJ family response regulator